MKEEIKKIISDATGVPADDFSVEVSDNPAHGDYSTNVALGLSKKLGKNPKEAAEEIKQKIKSDLFEKTEVAGPGFINFFVSPKVILENIKKIDKNYGKNSELKNKKIIIDYTDPNPFKEFHIGHLMSNAIGESLSRIFEFEGAKVKRVCYQGDLGIHVAKAIWGLKEMREKRSSGFKANSIKDWAMGYAFGAQMYEDDKAAKKEIQDLNKKIYERSDKEINKFYDEGKKESLKHFDEIYKKLDTKFDYFVFESEAGPVGKKIVSDNLGKVFEKGDNGAVIFRGEKFGLHTRVFINSEGLPTYEAKDLGLAEIKYKKYAYDQSVIVTGNEVNEYFKVMLAAMKQANPRLAERTKHIGHGMLRLPEGKMSSRSGIVERDESGKIINVISKAIPAELLIEKVEELVKEKIKNREFSDAEKKEISEKVAVGAIKYSVLKQKIGHDIVFNIEHSVSFEGDSGPYLQYAYTRAKSVLKKAKNEGIKPSFKVLPNEVTQLEKTMSYFPESVLQAAKTYEPHFILLYLTELAAIFNTYYAENKIVDKQDKNSSVYRVALTVAFTQIMENGMWLLGIQTLDRM